MIGDLHRSEFAPIFIGRVAAKGLRRQMLLRQARASKLGVVPRAAGPLTLSCPASAATATAAAVIRPFAVNNQSSRTPIRDGDAMTYV